MTFSLLPDGLAGVPGRVALGPPLNEPGYARRPVDVPGPVASQSPDGLPALPASRCSVETRPVGPPASTGAASPELVAWSRARPQPALAAGVGASGVRAMPRSVSGPLIEPAAVLMVDVRESVLVDLDLGLDLDATPVDDPMLLRGSSRSSAHGWCVGNSEGQDHAEQLLALGTQTGLVPR